MEIDWLKFSPFFRPENGREYEVLMSNWVQHDKEYNGKKKLVLEFDVHSIDSKEVKGITFTVSGSNALRFEDTVKRAEETGQSTILVKLRRNYDKSLDVADLRFVRKIVYNTDGGDTRSRR